MRWFDDHPNDHAHNSGDQRYLLKEDARSPWVVVLYYTSASRCWDFIIAGENPGKPWNHIPADEIPTILADPDSFWMSQQL